MGVGGVEGPRGGGSNKGGVGGGVEGLKECGRSGRENEGERG